jgi:hypothetical protein
MPTNATASSAGHAAAGKRKTGPPAQEVANAVLTRKQMAELPSDTAAAKKGMVKMQRGMGIYHEPVRASAVSQANKPHYDAMREAHDATHTFERMDAVHFLDDRVDPPIRTALVRGMGVGKGQRPPPPAAVAADSAAPPPPHPVAAPAGAAAEDGGAAKPPRSRNAVAVKKHRDTHKGDAGEPDTHPTRPGEQQLRVMVPLGEGNGLRQRVVAAIHCATSEAVDASDLALVLVAPVPLFDAPNPDGKHFKGPLTNTQLGNGMQPDGSIYIDSQYEGSPIVELQERCAPYRLRVAAPVAAPTAADAPVAQSPPAAQDN